MLDAKALASAPDLRPVLIRAGALGPETPDRDIRVSPNHRMLLRNELAEVMFGEREVLIAAKNLINLEGVECPETSGVTYVHVMFRRHEVILANGAWSESFQPGDYSLRSVGQAQRNEILTLFPELAAPSGLNGYQAARLSLKPHEAELLISEIGR